MPSPGPSCAAVAYVAGFVRALRSSTGMPAQPIVEGRKPAAQPPGRSTGWCWEKGVPFIRAMTRSSLSSLVAIGVRCRLTQPAPPLPITAGPLLRTTWRASLSCTPQWLVPVPAVTASVRHARSAAARVVDNADVVHQGVRQMNRPVSGGTAAKQPSRCGSFSARSALACSGPPMHHRRI